MDVAGRGGDCDDGSTAIVRILRRPQAGDRARYRPGSGSRTPRTSPPPAAPRPATLRRTPAESRDRHDRDQRHAQDVTDDYDPAAVEMAGQPREQRTGGQRRRNTRIDSATRASWSPIADASPAVHSTRTCVTPNAAGTVLVRWSAILTPSSLLTACAKPLTVPSMRRERDRFQG